MNAQKTPATPRNDADRPATTPSAKPDKADRLADALRANLRRRKAQARGRSLADEDGGEGAAER